MGFIEPPDPHRTLCALDEAIEGVAAVAKSDPQNGRLSAIMKALRSARGELEEIEPFKSAKP